jgi:hypothetical protein
MLFQKTATTTWQYFLGLNAWVPSTFRRHNIFLIKNCNNPHPYYNFQIYLYKNMDKWIRHIISKCLFNKNNDMSKIWQSQFSQYLPLQSLNISSKHMLKIAVIRNRFKNMAIIEEEFYNKK